MRLPQAGGQCSELYPKKPIYDIPGFPEILAGDLTSNLLEQGKQFQPGFTFGERAETIEKQEDGSFIVTTNKGTQHHAPIIAIAGGLGSFEPRKPKLEGIENYEDKGVNYFIKDPEVYRDKRWRNTSHRGRCIYSTFWFITKIRANRKLGTRDRKECH